MSLDVARENFEWRCRSAMNFMVNNRIYPESLDLSDIVQDALDARRALRVRLELEELVQALLGLLVLGLVQIGEPQLVIGIAPIGLDLGCDREIVDRFVELLVGEVDLADVVGQDLVLRKGFDGLLEVILGRFKIALLDVTFSDACQGLGPHLLPRDRVGEGGVGGLRVDRQGRIVLALLAIAVADAHFDLIDGGVT